jgi:hypothetical protein
MKIITTENEYQEALQEAEALIEADPKPGTS